MVLGQSGYVVYIDETKCTFNSGGDTLGRGLCDRQRNMWQKNMKTDFKNVSCEDVSWVEMEHNRV